MDYFFQTKVEPIQYKEGGNKQKIVDELYQKINTSVSMKNVKDTIKNYDDEIIIDMCMSHISKKWMQNWIRHVLPTTDRPIIFTMVKNNVPIDIIEGIVDKINLDCVIDNKTCLWETNNCHYILELLQSKKLNFNINHIDDNRMTFFANLIATNPSDACDDIIQIMKILIERGYNFNLTYRWFMSLLDILFSNSELPGIKLIQEIIILCDISSSTLWLNKLLNCGNFQYICHILNDITNQYDKNILIKTAIKYIGSYSTADNDMLILLTAMRSICADNILRLMLGFTDDEGNTFSHLAALFHLEQTMRFLKLILKIDHTSIKNNANDTPLDLFHKGSIINIL